MSKEFISVIVPAFNESQSICRVLTEIRDNCKASVWTFEILVIDDNSLDGTAALVSRAFHTDFKIRCFHLSQRIGLGASIRFGLKHSRAPIIIGFDSDGNHDSSVLPLLLQNLINTDAVIASRFVRGGGMKPALKFYTSYTFNWFLKRALGFPVWDNTSGCYALKRATLDRLDLTSIFRGFGEYHIRLVYHLAHLGFQIREVPIRYGDRIGGQRKSNPGRMFVTYLRTALALRLGLE